MQFNGNKRYNDYATFIKNKFGERVQKISLDTGFTCPNRDGTKGVAKTNAEKIQGMLRKIINTPLQKLYEVE